MVQFTIGCDPEVFVSHKGKITSAYGLIPGTKESPHKIAKGAIQVDGMALEFNTDPVVLESYGDGVTRWCSNVRNVLQGLRNTLPEEYAISIRPSHKFGKEYIEAQPDKAKELGCDPDFNAYTGEANPAPDGGADFRTAAGHIHIGWGQDIPVDHPDHLDICRRFIKNMDLTAGILSVIIDPDPVRRELYGKAGAFRPKSYGVEYRTPSNAWIKNDDLRKRMYFATQLAVDNTKKGYNALTYNITEETLQKVINASDVESAARIAGVLASAGGSARYAFNGLIK